MRVQCLVQLWSCLLLSLVQPAWSQTLIAKYSFDNTPQDLSGNNNHGVIRGQVTPAMDRFGHHCGAYRFDGGGYIEVPTSPTLEAPAGSITITAWYRLEQKRNNQWLTILCKGASSTERPDNPQYRLQVQQNTTPLTGICSGNQPAPSSTVSLNTGFTKCDNQFTAHAFQPYEWQFYAMVFDGHTVVTYMNGQKVFDYAYNGILQKNNTSLYIGLDEPGVTENFLGCLDDLRIYREALSAAQILNVYNEQSAATYNNKEEFSLAPLLNKEVMLPARYCEVSVTFGAPKATNGSCGKITVTQVAGQPSGTPLVPGRHLVAFSAFSESGYTQNQGFTITVKDNTPPVIATPRDTTIFIPAGTHHADWPYKMPVATDNCRLRSLQLTRGLPPGGEFTPGQHIIAYTATDIYGNASTKSFTVKVKEKPVPPPSSVPAIQPVPPPPAPVQPPADSIKPGKILPLPPDFNKRPSIEQQTVEVSNTHLRIMMYDNAEYDGDTVSMVLNSKTIIQHHEVNVKGTELFIDIDSVIDNELIMYAENEGSIKPNTALLVLYDGDKRYEISMSSTLLKNGMIRIRKKRK